MGGPDIDYSEGLTRPRRSLYFRHAAEKQMEFLKLFDVAAVTECYQRKESVLPQQALALANSELTIRNARILARRLAGRCRCGPEAVRADGIRAGPVAASDGRKKRQSAWRSCSNRRRHSAGNPQPVGAEERGRPTAGAAELQARENLVHVLAESPRFRDDTLMRTAERRSPANKLRQRAGGNHF